MILPLLTALATVAFLAFAVSGALVLKGNRGVWPTITFLCFAAFIVFGAAFLIVRTL